jgi:peptidoglycan hydrolase CwlO-like protein
MFRKIIIIFLIVFFISLFLHGITTLEGVSNIGDTGASALSEEQLHSERNRLINSQAAAIKQKKEERERERKRREAARRAALENAEKRRQELLAETRRQQAERDEERRRSQPTSQIRNTYPNARKPIAKSFRRRR